ncbi:MAG: hypothetical protein AAB367_04500 [Patescibacteria group bacterium]
MTQSIKRFRIGTYAPWTIAVAMIVALGLLVPLGVGTEQTNTGSTYIGRMIDTGPDDNIQRDIALVPRVELMAGDLIAFDWTEPTVTQSSGTIDTNQTGAAIELTKTESGVYQFMQGGKKADLTTATTMAQAGLGVCETMICTAFYDDTGASGAISTTAAGILVGSITFAGIDDGSRGSPHDIGALARVPGHSSNDPQARTTS